MFSALPYQGVLPQKPLDDKLTLPYSVLPHILSGYTDGVLPFRRVLPRVGTLRSVLETQVRDAPVKAAPEKAAPANAVPEDAPPEDAPPEAPK